MFCDKGILQLTWTMHNTKLRHTRLFVFHAQATFKVMGGWIPTCESTHSWGIYSADPLPRSTMNQYPTQYHYFNTVATGRAGCQSF